MPNPAPAPDKREQNSRFPALDEGLVIALFWVLALVVFVQFFTRYVLNDSVGWTEELARYLLVIVTFAGACIAVRRNSHISVEFFYRYLPASAARGLSSVVDLLRVGLLAVLTGLSVELAGNTRQMMTSIELPKSVLYGFVAGCFALMTVYSAIVAWRHLVSRKADVAPDVPTGLWE
ncbi:TRAP transporter small permease [Marinobacter sp. SS13-12]|uniref:TRAP transporter small permease n=1 Tax=Marinobacter sp. SS13-12 TaxID=3050451 RepID=UPI00255728EE|nr:TRAP transporter small permease [Marinobacter sp. SS13-12]MDK8461934.1 TRAP transporter small permease [Marinobacter sp. SS13-12]